MGLPLSPGENGRAKRLTSPQARSRGRKFRAHGRTPRNRREKRQHHPPRSGRPGRDRQANASCHGLPLPDRVGQEFADTGLEGQATRLHMLVDGLTFQTAVFSHHFTPEAMRRIVHDELCLIEAQFKSMRPG
ncbi:TetR family transcriptional regulator C-terminal domain-containing protein [Nonomuraea deserti]|nr:TetR family transcriptional regulator C-terminal domain-containing protein [Nonomuraea deserti]